MSRGEFIVKPPTRSGEGYTRATMPRFDHQGNLVKPVDEMIGEPTTPGDPAPELGSLAAHDEQPIIIDSAEQSL